MDLACFDVFEVDAGIANVWIREGDNLAAVAGIGQDFLIAGHCRVENYFTDGMTGRADGKTAKNRSVCKR